MRSINSKGAYYGGMHEQPNPPIALSIVIPAFDEEKSISDAVHGIQKTLKALPIEGEILVVDDASRDRTLSIVKDLCQEIPNLRYATHSKNQGIGGAFITGMKQARGEFCLLIPADNPLTPEQLVPFLEKIGNWDLILGYRDKRVDYNPLMRFNSKIYLFLVHVIFGLNFRDVNWIQLYRRSMFFKLRADFMGIVMLVEIILKAKLLNLRITEVPCPMQPRRAGTPSAARLRVMVRTGRDLLILIFRFWSGSLKVGPGEGIISDT